MTIDIFSLEAWTTVEGFPQPDWKIIREHIQRSYPKTQHPAIWQAASVQWVEAIADILGPTYNLFQSPNCILLTEKSAGSAKGVLQMCEGALRKLRAFLGPIAWEWTNGKHAVFMFEDIELYYQYISHFYPEEGEFASSGGCLVNDGYYHTVLPPLKDPASALVHELTHLLVCRLKIPTWLNEGLATNAEEIVLGDTHRRIDRDLASQHFAHWTSETIQEFWSGKSFSSVDHQRVSYSLAQILFHNMRHDYPKLAEFIKDANRADAGEASALRHLGVSLGDVAATFLGEGNWKPKPAPLIEP